MKQRKHKLFGQAIIVRKAQQRIRLENKHLAQLWAQLPSYREIITKLNEDYNFEWWLECRWDAPHLGIILSAARRYRNHQKWQAHYCFTSFQTEETLRHAMETLKMAFQRSEKEHNLI